MRPLAIICLFGAIAVSALTPGCGGGGGAASGRAVFKVIWPTPSRLIPLAANSIKVDIKRGTVVVASKILVRPPAGGQGQADFDILPIGNLTATATAYPNPDATGTAQATATVTLQTVSGQIVPVNLTMASTISQINVSPISAAIDVGQSVPLAISPKDASGNVVLVAPSKLSFTVSDGLVAGVDSTGKLTGNGVGSATVTVTDTESGKSAVMTVNVAPAGTGSGTPTPVKVSIDWAARSRGLSGPSSALSAKLTLIGAGLPSGDFSFTVDRDPAPGAYTANYTSPNSARSGYSVLDVKFYSQAGGTGSIVGTAGAGVSIKSDGTGIGNIATVGKVASVSVPAGQKLKIGQKVDLIFNARDSQGNTLALTPGAAFWQVVGGQANLKITNGQAQGLDGGTAQVTATVDNHTSSAMDVEIDCPLPPNGYTVTLLPDLGWLGTGAYGISNTGFITGASWTAPLTGPHAAILKDGVITDLGFLPGGSEATGFAVNNLGMVAGRCGQGGSNVDTQQHAFFYQNGIMTDINPPGASYSYAWGINDLGQVVGWGSRPYLWQNGNFTWLEQPGWIGVYPQAINNLSQVTGTYQAADLSGGAFIWQNGSFQTIPPPAGMNWYTVTAINDLGYVTGSIAAPGSGLEHACVYKNGATIDLGMLPPSTLSRALALNNIGAVVGMSTVGATTGPPHPHAFISCGGVMRDLNDVAPPGGDWVLTYGYGINDSGQIICWGQHFDVPQENGGNFGRTFLLTPKP